MPKTMVMPKLGVNMTDALIVKWVVKEGDFIKLDQHILDAETDKATQEINATAEGVVVKILVKEFDRVMCQQPIMILAEPGENVDASYIEKLDTGTQTEDKKQPVKNTEAVINEAAADKEKASPETTVHIKISPLAEKLATELGIDYRLVKPSQPGARISKADILAYMDSKNKSENQAAAVIGNTSASRTDSDQCPVRGKVPIAGIRKVIAERMTESVLTKPSVALTLHADASGLMAWREQTKKTQYPLKYDEMLVAIIAKALREFPILNSKIADDEIHLLDEINVGVAVDTENGLIVPVIHNADKKGLVEIRDELGLKVQAVKAGKTNLEDITGGTFTVTNLGMFGIEQFDAIINPPECAILAVGAIVKEPVVEDDEIVIGKRMQLTLVFDHRIVDGAPAARFLQRIKELVENPIKLLC